MFPVAAAVRDFLKLVAWSIEQGKGLGSAFYGPGFMSAGTLRQPVLGDDFELSIQNLFLFFA